jgi:transposase InsO family protein
LVFATAPKWLIHKRGPQQLVDVVDVLEGVCRERGYPASMWVDQESEFISRELGLWVYMKGVTLAFS